VLQENMMNNTKCWWEFEWASAWGRINGIHHYNYHKTTFNQHRLSSDIPDMDSQVEESKLTSMFHDLELTMLGIPHPWIVTFLKKNPNRIGKRLPFVAKCFQWNSTMITFCDIQSQIFQEMFLNRCNQERKGLETKHNEQKIHVGNIIALKNTFILLNIIHSTTTKKTQLHHH